MTDDANIFRTACSFPSRVTAPSNRAIDLDVAVGGDPRTFHWAYSIGRNRSERGQGAQCLLVHFGEGAGAPLVQLIEGPPVRVGEQRAHRMVQFVEAEEALVA